MRRCWQLPRGHSIHSLQTLYSSEHQEPYQDLYENIGNDLVAIREKLSVRDLQTIRDVSTLVYANDLSPESFGHMLTTDDAGLLEAASLPAENDPMLGRGKNARQTHVFIDTVDEYYGALHEEMVRPISCGVGTPTISWSNLSVANRSLLGRISSAAAMAISR